MASSTFTGRAVSVADSVILVVLVVVDVVLDVVVPVVTEVLVVVVVVVVVVVHSTVLFVSSFMNGAAAPPSTALYTTHVSSLIT